MANTLTQMYFMLTSISTVIAGMNCILFFFCIYVLWGQKSKSRRFLLIASTVQFCLCITQIALFIIYFSVAFTFHAQEVEMYFMHLSRFALPCYIIYILNNVIEALLLIWRIYILYDYDLKVCMPTVLLLALEVGFAGATARGAATPHVDIHRLHIFNLITWSLIAAVNASATTLIGLRLWTARRNAKTFLSLSMYKSTIIAVVECGALVTLCTVAMLILHAVEHPVGIAGLGIMTQVATMVPLLIIARYGILSRQDKRGARGAAAQIPLRVSVVRTEDTRVDAAVEYTRKDRALLLDPLPDYPGHDHRKPFSDACGEGSLCQLGGQVLQLEGGWSH